MRVLITGATGFIGRALVLRLQRDGHEVIAWVRSPANARAKLGADVTLLDARQRGALAAAVEAADAVVNLAGEPIVGRRWSAARRRALVESRVGVTRALVAAIASAKRRPRVLLSASGIGYYGNRPGERLDEASTPGGDFLATLCRRWEEAAAPAEALGVRTVVFRIGVVLGLGGGALERLLPVFRLGLGGPLGSGRQHVSFIHLVDLVEAMANALGDDRYRGALDAVAPNPVTMAELARALGRALGRPAALRVPSFALRIALGGAAASLLYSQRSEGAGLAALGFRHRFPSIDEALAEVVGRLRAVQIRPIDAGAPEPIERGAYLAERPPHYLLRDRVTLDAPRDDVFAFFSRPENLGLLTPAEMSFRMTGKPEEVRRGAIIDYAIRIARLGLSWRTVIEAWAPGRHFVDSQTRGPYRSWWHEHHFGADGARTVMEDRVYYAPPLGLLGRIAHALFIAPTLRRIFAYRAEAIALRFRTAPPASPAV